MKGDHQHAKYERTPEIALTGTGSDSSLAYIRRVGYCGHYRPGRGADSGLGCWIVCRMGIWKELTNAELSRSSGREYLLSTNLECSGGNR